MLAWCNPSEGKYMAVCLNYRGPHLNINAVCPKIKTMRTIQFVDWCPTGFKMGRNPRGMRSVQGSGIAESAGAVYLIANSTSVRKVFSCMKQRFDNLFKQRTEVHQYLSEGMEESEFSENLEALTNLECTYRSCEIEDELDEEEGME